MEDSICIDNITIDNNYKVGAMLLLCGANSMRQFRHNEFADGNPTLRKCKIII